MKAIIDQTKLINFFKKNIVLCGRHCKRMRKQITDSKKMLAKTYLIKDLCKIYIKKCSKLSNKSMSNLIKMWANGLSRHLTKDYIDGK